MVILNMRLEVLGEMIDALAQQRNLHFGRAGVRRVNPELLDYTLFALFRSSHKSPLCFLFPSFLVELFLAHGHHLVKLTQAVQISGLALRSTTQLDASRHPA